MARKKKQEPVNEWGRVFAELAKDLGVYEAWRTWIYITGSKLAYMAGNRIKTLQDEYEHLMEKLTDDQKKLIDDLNRIMGEELDKQPFQDFIGQRYMEIQANEHNSKGQVFTPYNMAQLTASLSYDKEEVDQAIADKGYVTVDDCAIGAGCLPIATLERLHKDGVNLHSQVWVSGTDPSEIALLQAYIQLSLLGVSAVLCKGDSILDKYDYDLLTEAACYPGWIERKMKYGLPNPMYQLHDAYNWRRND